MPLQPCRAVAAVPIGFPFALEDDELDKAISEMLEAANWPGFDNFGRLLPELKLALLTAGLRERQARREAASAEKALRVAYATLAVSIVALVIAVIASLTS
jgi:hypothetical protein